MTILRSFIPQAVLATLGVLTCSNHLRTVVGFSPPCRPSPPSPPPSPPPVPAGVCPTLAFAKCAGDGIAEELCCPEHFKCAKKDAHTSTCEPFPFVPPSPPASPPPPPSPHLPPAQCVAAYGQCAGNGIPKELCCAAGFTCTRETEFYSQCKPTTVALF